jgi:hypothetical protein
MIATEPVNLCVLDNDEMYEYEKGDRKTYTVTWSSPRSSSLDETFSLGPGTWHLVVEGWMKKSKGKILIRP